MFATCEKSYSSAQINSTVIFNWYLKDLKIIKSVQLNFREIILQ